jgi:hypothetical protein
MNRSPRLACSAKPEKYANPMIINGMTTVNSWIDTSPPWVAPSISTNRSTTAMLVRSYVTA